jgi:ATP-dependent helicase/nuclease subunit A
LSERQEQPDRFQRGRLIHALLQYLPDAPPAEREQAARNWLQRSGPNLASHALDNIVAELLSLLAHPELAPAFGPNSRAEVPLSGVIGNAVVGGLVDRLAVLPDRVIVVDFKTNRRPPETPENTPILYLRQMAAYRAVLRGIFPGRAVCCALVWTRTAQVSFLSDALLDKHAPDAVPPVAQLA